MTIYFTSGDNGEDDENEDKAFEIKVEYILPGNAEIIVKEMKIYKTISIFVELKETGYYNFF